MGTLRRRLRYNCRYSLPGLYADVCVINNNHIVLLDSTQNVDGGHTVLEYQNGIFTYLAGGSINIGCGAFGSVFGTNSFDQVWKLSRKACPSGSTLDKSGNCVYSGTMPALNVVNGVLSGIKSVSPVNDYHVWGVNTSNQVFLCTGSLAVYWAQQPGSLTNISAASDNTVIGCTPAGAVSQLVYGVWTNLAYNPNNTPFKYASCGSATNIWAVDTSGNTWSYANNNWVQVTGVTNMAMISNGADGSTWGVDTQNNLYQYDGNNKWTQISGSYIDVCVINNEHVVALNTATTNGGNTIGEYQNGTWTVVPGGFVNVGCGAYGSVWATNYYTQVAEISRT